MSDLPESVFIVKRVIQGPLVPGAVVLYAKRAERAVKTCGDCVVDSSAPPSALTVDAFSDLYDIAGDCDCFFPSGPPLICWRNATRSMAKSLSGVVDVDVGFRTWDQTEVASDEMFCSEPKLGALYVNACCKKAKDVRGRGFRRCKNCGRQQVDWSKLVDRLHDIRISAAEWPETDVFLVEGGSQSRGVCITSTGLQKLGEYRETLELVELEWY